VKEGLPIKTTKDRLGVNKKCVTTQKMLADAKKVNEGVRASGLAGTPASKNTPEGRKLDA